MRTLFYFINMTKF